MDLISRTPNHIRFDVAEPERASVPNQGTAAISAIPMETMNLLLAQMVGMMQKFDGYDDTASNVIRNGGHYSPQWQQKATG